MGSTLLFTIDVMIILIFSFAWVSSAAFFFSNSLLGRTKLESIELDDDVKPENSHVARVVVEDDEGEEMEILRHSLPYGDGKGEQGLFFIAYTKDLSIIDAMLLRMFGTSGDGIHDRMLHFVTPVDGAYYFAPSEELLEEVLEG